MYHFEYLKTIKKERLDIVGQQLPEEPIKGPINFNGILIFPVTLSWIEYQIKPGLFPVTETVLSKHAFNDLDLKNILVDYLHNNNLSQLRIAETEKFAHVKKFS